MSGSTGRRLGEVLSGETVRIPDGMKPRWLRSARGASREDFEKRRSELAQAGLHAGSFVREYGAAAGNGLLSERVYEHLTLVANDFRIHEIHGDIRKRWEALGGQHWGSPETDEVDAGPGGGRQNVFDLAQPGPGGGRKGAIVWSGATGAHDVAGTVYDKYAASGAAPALGYPVTGTWRTSRGDGCFNAFRRAYQDDRETAIHLRDGGQPWVTHGDIRATWAGMGWEHSPLGYPTSDEFGPYDGPDPQRRQYFEGGTMIWRPGVGAGVETPEYNIRFRGLHVVRQGPDQSSPGVEFYFITGAIPRLRPETAATAKLPRNALEYGSLRAGRWRHDDVVVYRGAADSLLLTVSGAERDHGNPDHYLALITEGTKKAVGFAITALGALLGGAGAAIGGAVGGPLSEKLGTELGKLINNALDTGDDPLNSAAVPLSVRAVRDYLGAGPLMADTRTGSGQAAVPIPYHFIVPMEGGGHRVDLFFEVRHGAG